MDKTIDIIVNNEKFKPFNFFRGKQLRSDEMCDYRSPYYFDPQDRNKLDPFSLNNERDDDYFI